MEGGGGWRAQIVFGDVNNPVKRICGFDACSLALLIVQLLNIRKVKCEVQVQCQAFHVASKR